MHDIFKGRISEIKKRKRRQIQMTDDLLKNVYLKRSAEDMSIWQTQSRGR